MKHIVLPDLAGKHFTYIYPMLDLVKNGIAITNSNSEILYVNPFYSVITGYARAEVIGQNPGILRSGYHDEYFYKSMWTGINEQGYWEGEIWNRNKSGAVYPTILTISKINNEFDHIVNYIAIFSDISFIKQDEKNKINLALYDPLTKLPNRLFTEDYFKRITSNYKRKLYAFGNTETNKNKVAVIFLDLNKFKSVNDTYGHVIGDKLLKQIAERLQAATRGSDIISRFGGDEFVAIVPEISTQADVESYCDRIKNIFTHNFMIDDLIINSSCSIGFSIFPDDAEDFETLISKADAQMYKDKRR